MKTHRQIDGTHIFATGALALAAVAFGFMVVSAVSNDSDPTPIPERSTPVDNPTVNGSETDGITRDQPTDVAADPTADPRVVVDEAAAEMALVTSVEFRLARSGAPIFIDQFQKLALDRLRGQFTVPGKAQAELTVTVDSEFTTKIGAIALAEEVWISNPVTGDFETLPTGYDIDPSRFFDPENGWRPLLTNLQDVELVEIDDRGGQRYHVRGLAPAEEVRNITVGLVSGQDVPVDLWIQPGTNLVTAAEFTTTLDGQDSAWVLELERYGDEFTISAPENVRS
jgi:hypothetical protein